jgi:hypothetical protein
MPVSKGPNCVGEEMSRFKRGELHSGGSGKVVTDRKQALAVALNACGQSKYAEVLQSIGYSEEVAKEIVAMFGESLVKSSKHSVSSPSFEELNWEKNFKTGKRPGPENPENYKTGTPKPSSVGNMPISKTGVKGDLGRREVNNDSEMLSPVSFPKQDASWGQPPSRQLNGMRQL